MKKIQIIFIAFFMAVILSSIVFFDFKSEISVKENRTLQSFPHNFREADTYIQDRFGLRDIYLDISKYFNNPRLSSNAVLGKDGWLFYTGDYNKLDFFKTNTGENTRDEAVIFADRLQSMADWCTSEGIEFIALVPPNKHSVYGEFYPVARPDGRTLMDIYAEEASKKAINFIWARDEIISHKKDNSFPLYYKTDTHWNPAGAKIYSDLLNDMIKKSFPNVSFPEIDYKTECTPVSVSHRDIIATLNSPKSFKDYDVTLTPAGGSFEDYYTYIKNEGGDGIITEGKDPSLPRALIYRDSYGTALIPFTSPMFSHAEYRWKSFTQDEKDYVLSYKPDIIICETVERYVFFGNLAREMFD